MTASKKTMAFEELEMRCPKLGGPVTFRYCRSVAGDARSCHKILDCWWQRFDVAGYLKDRLTDPEFEALGRNRPPPKITSLIELIAQAKKNSGGE